MKRLSIRHAVIIGGGFVAGFGLAWWLLIRAGAPAAAPRHVVLFTLDTTRADAIGSYGSPTAVTPHLDALAARGVRFADAVTAAPLTGPAHAAIFTGMYPARFGVRDNATTPLPGEAVTLAERLQAAGLATGGFIGAFVLDRPYGFAQGFDVFRGFSRVDPGREATAERRGSDVVDDAVRWLADVPIDQPFFLWVHLYDPHTPYAAPEPFGSRHGARPYDGEVAYVDHQVGRLLETLRTRGVVNETLVAAVADHGESLGEHGEDDHGVFLYEPVLRVPWILAGPSVGAGRIVTEQVRVIDVAPTILDLLGLPPLDGTDGESLVPVLRGQVRNPIPAAYAESYYSRFHLGWSELRTLRADGWKVIDAPRPELYAAHDDPVEAVNRYEAQRSLADRMIAEARKLEETLTGGRRAEAPAPDAETLARLRSLGYVGTSVPSPSAAGGGLPDPKDRMEAWGRYKRSFTSAIDDLAASRIDAAIATLRDLIRTHEGAYDLHELLGEAYRRQGRLPQALGEFEMASLINPTAPGPHLSAAEVLLAMGRAADAATPLDQARRLAPESFDVAYVDAKVLEATGRVDEAVAAYGRGIDINPANPRIRLDLAVLASRTRRLDLADAQLRHLLTMGYQPSRTHVAIGQVAEMRGDAAGARLAYERALAIEPGLPVAEAALRRLR